MTELDGPKCAAKYCRSAAVAGYKYCAKHETMHPQDIIAEGNSLEKRLRITISEKTRDMLIDIALQKLLEEMDK